MVGDLRNGSDARRASCRRSSDALRMPTVGAHETVLTGGPTCCSSARPADTSSSSWRSRDAWGGYTRVWVTFDKSDARSLLRGEQVVYAYGPTNRSLKNLLRNLVVAWRTLRDVRPHVVLTTGRGCRGAVRMARTSPRRAARVRRELHSHRRAVADVSSRRSGRRSRLRAVARARPRSPEGALRREPSSGRR